LRNKKVDEIIEGMFGKPDYTCSQVIGGEVYTPLSGNPSMIRVDPVGLDMNRFGVKGYENVNGEKRPGD
jgi:hypothetical protein